MIQCHIWYERHWSLPQTWNCGKVVFYVMNASFWSHVHVMNLNTDMCVTAVSDSVYCSYLGIMRDCVMPLGFLWNRCSLQIQRSCVFKHLWEDMHNNTTLQKDQKECAGITNNAGGKVFRQRIHCKNALQ